MGKMSNYADGLRMETSAVNGILENFKDLKGLRKNLVVDIQDITQILLDLHTELTNVDDMLFEMQETLSEHGVSVE